jgi:hypothetical protein
MIWGLDMVGPLKKTPGGFTHLLVAVDKFTKWIEAKPITNIRSEEAVKFFLNIIYRFGVLNYIITDHRTNFTRKKFLDFCDGYSIKIDWAPAYEWSGRASQWHDPPRTQAPHLRPT